MNVQATQCSLIRSQNNKLSVIKAYSCKTDLQRDFHFCHDKDNLPLCNICLFDDSIIN